MKKKVKFKTYDQLLDNLRLSNKVAISSSLLFSRVKEHMFIYKQIKKAPSNLLST